MNFQHLNTCRSEMSRCVSSVSLSVSLYCLHSLLFTPQSLCLCLSVRISFHSFITSLHLYLPSPYICPIHSRAGCLHSLSLIFNLSVPPFLHFFFIFRSQWIWWLSAMPHPERLRSVAASLLATRQSHHRLSALIRGRSFSFFTSHPSSSSSLSLSRALAPPQQRSWRWKQPQMVLSLTSSRSTTTTERVWRRLRRERSGTHERSRGNIYEWVTPLAQLHVSRLSDTRAEQVQAGERPRGGSFPLSPDPLRIKQRRKEREKPQHEQLQEEMQEGDTEVCSVPLQTYYRYTQCRYSSWLFLIFWSFSSWKYWYLGLLWCVCICNGI